MPINPEYVLFHDQEKVVIRNYEGKVFEYPEQAHADAPRNPVAASVMDEFLYS